MSLFNWLIYVILGYLILFKNLERKGGVLVLSDRLDCIVVREKLYEVFLIMWGGKEFL